MKPNFALNLTHESIGLLHRSGRGWTEIGVAELDAPDLGEALTYLRRSALGLSPSGFATKLIIPNSQILYDRVHAPGPDDDSRRAQIARALEGRTPYRVEELAFDWWGEGDEVEVAVVAKETLAEAEQFAQQYKFNPVSFVAIPDGQDFAGEPFFGTTKSADQPVERDEAPVTILHREPAQPDPVPEPEPLPAPEPEPLPGPEPLPAPMPEPEPVPGPEPEPEDEPLPEPEVVPEEEPELEPELEPDAPYEIPFPDDDDLRPEAPVEVPLDPGIHEMPPMVDPDLPPLTMEDEAPVALDIVDDLEAEAALARALDTTTPVLTARAARVSLAPFGASEAGGGEDASATAGSAQKAAATEGETAAQPEAPTFASRRRPEPLRATREGPAPAPKQPAPKPPARKEPTGKELAGKEPEAAPAARAKETAGKAAKAAGQFGAATAKSAGKALSALVTAPGIPGLKPAKTAAPAAKPKAKPPAARTRAAEAAPGLSPDVAEKALARFNRAPTRGKPRYLGLILTGVLLLVLAIIAAWSSIYLASSSDSDGATDTALATAEQAEPQTPATDAPDTALAAADTAPAIDDEALADGQDPEAMSIAEAEADGQLPEDVTAGPAETALSDAPPADAASGAGAGAEMPAAAAQDAGTAAQGEIVLSSMDTPPQPLDPLALPSPDAASDAPPAAQAPPPPFGTLYEFDAEGRIKPTPEGVVTPDGVLLVAGRPPLAPPARPVVEVAPETAPEAAPETAVEAALPPADAPAEPGDNAATTEGALTASAEPTGADVFQADPALAGFRPLGRPAALVPPTEAPADTTGEAPADGTADPAADPSAETSAEGGEDANLAIPEDARFASLRPRLRPAAVVAAAEEARKAEDARKATEAASIAAAAAAAAEAAVADELAAEEARLASASPLAVQVSRRPAARPNDLSRAVQAAAAAAVRAVPTEPAPPPAPEPEPAPTQRAAVRTPSPPDAPTVFSAPEADDEPEVSASASRGSAPKGVVAKNATFVNAINLSKLNLIGVYGTQSKRYALIRESNGRYKKIKVGDRLDGGRVAAITASEVRYQKGGRMLVLAMPKG
ncbi:hypothetical protein E7811_01995 [Aliigemmobacter aestuarii]|uniref:Translation initiation factor 2 n=1 Tax=Aliigemmobacter aestuarii TaxID=1445661 RepID=A0A4S3MQ13_9RHOB|nr:pilus assembly protein PilP [Gemmobacter aestuarii]THD84538.1 hypothetical protein E7811_01995 [Gemmobacter aestuarii]